MGCDIHLHWELKIDNKWHHYISYGGPRNYNVFEKMAGVRGDIQNAVVEPKGLPEDATFMTKFDCTKMDTDGHSHSWFNSEEIEKLFEWIEKEYPDMTYNYNFANSWGGYLFGNHFWSFRKYPNDYPKEIQDIRLIFWFDN